MSLCFFLSPANAPVGAACLFRGKKNDAEPVFAQNHTSTCLQLPESLANAPVAGQVQF